MNEALPYLVATGLGRAYGQRLQMAAATQPNSTYIAMYPYWIMMHASMAPPPSSSGGVAGATGAASGGGGAGGSF
jgi:hypothetical protein